jgi:DNA-binding NarL/FixJ family response regulator
MAQVVAAIPDLFFRAKVLETAKRLSVDVSVARDADELLRQVREEKPRLVLIDLGDARVRGIETLPALAGIPVVGFCNHEREDLMEQARAAGCGEVLTKGRFSAGLPELLRRAGS